MKSISSHQAILKNHNSNSRTGQASNGASKTAIFNKIIILISSIQRASSFQNSNNLNTPRTVTLESLSKSIPIEAYNPHNTTYSELINYNDMQKMFAGPAGALAIKLESDDEKKSLFIPYCSGTLVADNLVLTAGHCDLQNKNTSFNIFSEQPVTFLNCYQQALSPDGDKGETEVGLLRDCYAFDVVDRYSAFEYTTNGNTINFIHDHALLTLESSAAGELFGTLGIDLSGEPPIIANHHATGAPLHFSPLIPLGSITHHRDDNRNSTFLTVHGDLMPGSSGSAQVNERGEVASVTSWGRSHCLGDSNRATTESPSIDDLILISSNLQKLDGLNISDHCNHIPTIEHAPTEDESCYIGSQQMKSIFDHLPSELQDILENNSNNAPGNLNFSDYSQYMMHCYCNGFKLDPTNYPSSQPTDSLSPSLKSSGVPSAQPSASNLPSLNPSNPLTSKPISAKSSQPTNTQDDSGNEKGSRILEILLPVLGGTGVIGLLYYLYQNRTPAAHNESAVTNIEIPEGH